MSNRIILVTDSSSGFGRLTAEARGRAGHTVYASMRNVAGRNASNAAELSAIAGSDTRPIELDVQAEPSVNAESGQIDVVVHNAGHMMFGPAEAFTPEQFVQQYDVNVPQHPARQSRGAATRLKAHQSAWAAPQKRSGVVFQKQKILCQ